MAAISYLLLGNCHFVSDVRKNGRLNVEPLREGSVASSHDLCPLRLAELDVAHDALELNVIHLRPLLRACVKLRSNLDGIGQGSGLGDKGVVNRFLNEETAAGAAALAVVQEKANVGRHDGLVKISVLKHDEGGLATELKSDLKEGELGSKGFVWASEAAPFSSWTAPRIAGSSCRRWWSQ